MPDTISCPQCQRKLLLPPAHLGQRVQCPGCHFNFVAETPPPLPFLGPIVPMEQEPGQPFLYPDAGRMPNQDWGPRNRPHRGGAILTLGIFSLLLSCVPLLGGGMGIAALAMASNDLQQMAHHRMDRSGELMTQFGQVFGIIAVVISALGLFFFCLSGGLRHTYF